MSAGNIFCGSATRENFLSNCHTRDRWRLKDTEIDIVGSDESRKHCLVAECKYRNEKTDLKTLRSLDAKTLQLPIDENAEIHRWLFSKSGFDDALLQL